MVKALGWLLLIVGLPVAGAVLGTHAAPALARTHPTVSLADRLRLEQEQGLTEQTLASEAFRAQGRSKVELFDQADRIERTFVWGAALLGLWIGLVVVGKLWGAAHPYAGTVAAVDHARCVHCARCFAWCPRERQRWKQDAGVEQPCH